MNKKGQIGIGTIILAFTIIIVGVALFVVVAQQTGEITSTIELENQSLVTVAVNDTPYVITNCRVISGAVFFNETGDVAITGTATIANNVVTNGALTVTVTPDVAEDEQNIWTVDATCQPLDYISDAGSRGITKLIVIFFALAIAVAALYPVVKDSLLEAFG